MSLQRKRGQWAKVYKTKLVTDDRGNAVKVPDLDGPYRVRAAFVPDRSARAEVPGQQQINVFTMICPPGTEDMDIWSRVDWNGSQWDIVTPPAYHHGSRQTRHWTLSIRRRPAKGKD